MGLFAANALYDLRAYLGKADGEGRIVVTLEPGDGGLEPAGDLLFVPFGFLPIACHDDGRSHDIAIRRHQHVAQEGILARFLEDPRFLLWSLGQLLQVRFLVQVAVHGLYPGDVEQALHAVDEGIARDLVQYRLQPFQLARRQQAVGFEIDQYNLLVTEQLPDTVVEDVFFIVLDQHLFGRDADLQIPDLGR